MDVEHRLNSFRRERVRNETFDEIKKFISTPFQKLRKRMSKLVANERVNCEVEINEDDLLLDSCSEAEDVTDLTDIGHIEEDANSISGLKGITKYLAYFILWVIPYIVLIMNGFGAVYFCVSALFFIYFNTRTKPKLKNEPSAYSVFNKGCEPIDGALSGEDLEKQIRSGILG